MIATFVATARLLRALARAVADPATRGLVVLAIVTLLVGTFYYASAEGWRFLDALYFSVVTLTTIGYGDLVVSTDGAKVFTIVYSFVGIGIIAAFITSLAVNIRAHDDRATRRRRRGPAGEPRPPRR